MRKIRFTEEQLKYILRHQLMEQFNSYIDNSDQGCDFPKNSTYSNGTEVLAKDPDGETNPTLDKISATKSKSYPFYAHRVSGLSERNHGLDGKTFSLGKNQLTELFFRAEWTKKR